MLKKVQKNKGAEEDYLWDDNPHSFHHSRRVELLKQHPGIKILMGPWRGTQVYLWGLVGLQLGLAFALKNAPWWLISALAFCVGTVISHALFVLVHECSHHLVSPSKVVNRMYILLADVGIGLPVGMGFSKYHLLHHQHLGSYKMDPDVPSKGESKWVSNKTWAKALWMAMFSLSQCFRPLKLRRYKKISVMDGWMLLDLVTTLGSVFLIVSFLGVKTYGFLFISTFMGLGLHPLGGRWIAEHYITNPGQETYSYYGPMNRLAFNMGYHIEHHDFFNIPWNRLPALKKLGGAAYTKYPSYRSWGWVLWNFITNKEMSSFSRMVR